MRIYIVLSLFLMGLLFLSNCSKVANPIKNNSSSEGYAKFVKDKPCGLYPHHFSSYNDFQKYEHNNGCVR